VKILQNLTAVHKGGQRVSWALGFILTLPTESPLGDELNEVKISF